jgi:hypothetical protein
MIKTREEKLADSYDDRQFETVRKSKIFEFEMKNSKFFSSESGEDCWLKRSSLVVD